MAEEQKTPIINQETTPNKVTQDELKMVPDSSWLIAILDESDSHHTPAASSLGALLPYKPIFYIPALVYLETISRLIRINKLSVKKCAEKIDKLLSKIEL